MAIAHHSLDRQKTLLNLAADPSVLSKLEVIALCFKNDRDVLTTNGSKMIKEKKKKKNNKTYGAVACWAAPIIAAVVGSTIAAISSIRKSH